MKVINRFDKGITNQHRNAREGYCKMSSHFDIFSSPNKLVPFRDMEDDGVGNSEQLERFVYTNGKHYALGIVTGSGKAKIYERASLPDGAWGASTTGEDSSGTRSRDCFVDYKGKLWGWTAGNRVWSYDYGTNTFTSTERSINYTGVAQGLVHSKDDILYLPYYYSTSDTVAIASYDGSTWNNTAITLPSNLIITSIAEYGNYIAIGCKPVNVGDSSIVYLWDRDASLTTLSESIDWGKGEELVSLIEYEGLLVGISSTAATSLVTNPKVLFKFYDGTGAKTFRELQASDITILFGGIQKADNRILFMMTLELDGTWKDGIWSIKKDLDGQLSVSLDTLLNNDTRPTPIEYYNPLGFILLGNYMTVAYSDLNGGGTYKVSRTNNASSFTATSIYETSVNPEMPKNDLGFKKQLKYVALTYESLPAGAQAVLKYKVDGGSWNTIFTETTSSALITEYSKPSDDTAFKKGYEYEFRIESTGGAEITGFYYDYNVFPTQD